MNGKEAKVVEDDERPPGKIPNRESKGGEKHNGNTDNRSEGRQENTLKKKIQENKNITERSEQ